VKWIFGLGLIGSAVWLSRGHAGAFSGLGDAVPADARGDALDAVQRAAFALYPVVDDLGPLDFMFADDDYRPSCEAFRSEADDSLAAALRAQEEGLPGELPVRVAATQAWALSEMECGGGPSWAHKAVEWPG